MDLWSRGALPIDLSPLTMDGVLALLQAEFISSGLIKEDIFIAGYGASQAIPGLLFTFSAYLGMFFNSGLSSWLTSFICLFVYLFIFYFSTVIFISHWYFTNLGRIKKNYFSNSLFKSYQCKCYWFANSGLVLPYYFMIFKK